jgi:hypothetical protein
MRIIRARAFGKPTENLIVNLARNISTMGPVRRLLAPLTDRLFLAPTLPGAELCVVERRERVVNHHPDQAQHLKQHREHSGSHMPGR